MILPLEEALSFTLTSLQFQYYVRNDYFLNVIVRGRTQKNIDILFEQFLSHFPINFPSASFTHSSLPFTLSPFTFPTLHFDVNFKAIFAHSFPFFAPPKKKKISVFLRRSLTFIFVPLSLLSIPTCALSLTHPPSLFPRDDVVGASHRKWRDAPGNFALTFIRM